MSILVTGATGFIGSALVEALLAKGYSVIGLGRSRRGLLPSHVLKNDKFRLVRADLARANLMSRMATQEITAIVHAAAMLSDAVATFNDFYSANVVSTRKLIDLARARSCGQLIYISTGSVYGARPEKKILDESVAPLPQSFYGLSKYISERLLAIDLKGSGTKACVIRPSIVIGKNNRKGLVPTFYEDALHNRDMVLRNGGRLYRNIIHVHKLVELILRAIESRDAMRDYEVFFAGSSDSITTYKLAGIMRRSVQSRSAIIRLDTTATTEWDVFIDTKKAKSMFGVRMQTVEESVKTYMRDMGHEI